MQRILITGGAGFIGSHLSEHLFKIHPDIHLTIVDNLSTGSAENLEVIRNVNPRPHPPAITFINRTVGNAIPLLENQHFDQIYHLAAAVGVRLILDEPIKTIETNVLETSQLLRYATAVNAPILIASSSEVYGKSTTIPFSEAQDVVYGSTEFTRWSYACTKALDEFLALAYHRQENLPVVLARFFNTVGPRQLGNYGMVLPRFIQAALQNQPLEVYADGTQIRCFCDVRDVVTVLPTLLKNKACHGGIYNVGHDQTITIIELAETVIRTLQSNSPINFIPYEKAYTAGFEDLAVRQPDLTRLRTATEFKPRIPLTQTIQDIAATLTERTPA